MGRRGICAIYTDAAILLAAASGLLAESEKELRLCTFFQIVQNNVMFRCLSFFFFLLSVFPLLPPFKGIFKIYLYRRWGGAFSFTAG